MKRVIIFVLCFSVLLCGCGLNGTLIDSENSYRFYYQSKEVEHLETEDSIRSEYRKLESDDLADLLSVYLAGPVSDDLISPFPAGTSVENIQNSSDMVTLTMSGEFFTLQGIQLSIAYCCLAETICSYADVDEIRIVDAMGQISIDLNPDDYLHQNDYNESAGSAFTIYFAKENGRYLVPETREAYLSENESPEAYVLRQLMDGPQRSDANKIIPEGTIVHSVDTKNGICVVNLSNEFYKKLEGDIYGSYLAIFGIVNSLTEIETVRVVQFMRDGNPAEHLGMISLEKPISPYDGAIDKSGISRSELDINFSIYEKRSNKLFEIPVCITQSATKSIAESVIRNLLNFIPPQGFYNALPDGTLLLGVTMSGGVCEIDFNAKIAEDLTTEEDARRAIYSLVAALTQLDSIASVVITVEGETVSLGGIDLSDPITTEDVKLN